MSDTDEQARPHDRGELSSEEADRFRHYQLRDNYGGVLADIIITTSQAPSGYAQNKEYWLLATNSSGEFKLSTMSGDARLRYNACGNGNNNAPPFSSNNANLGPFDNVGFSSNPPNGFFHNANNIFIRSRPNHPDQALAVRFSSDHKTVLFLGWIQETAQSPHKIFKYRSLSDVRVFTRQTELSGNGWEMAVQSYP